VCCKSAARALPVNGVSESEGEAETGISLG
jgi:hypothetical protein